MNTEYIEHIHHRGIVKSVNQKKRIVRVSVSDDGDCGSCPAARLCSISQKNGGNKNEIEVFVSDASGYEVGEIVDVYGTEGMHKKAILVAMVVPCLILVAVMVGIYSVTSDQAFSALCGLGAVILVYLIFYLLRRHIAHQFNFMIKKRYDRD